MPGTPKVLGSNPTGPVFFFKWEKVRLKKNAGFITSAYVLSALLPYFRIVFFS